MFLSLPRLHPSLNEKALLLRSVRWQTIQAHAEKGGLSECGSQKSPHASVPAFVRACESKPFNRKLHMSCHVYSISGRPFQLAISPLRSFCETQALRLLQVVGGWVGAVPGSEVAGGGQDFFVASYILWFEAWWCSSHDVSEGTELST